MLKAKSIDLVREPLLPAIFKYSIPIVIAGILQALFNIADQAVLGWFDTSADSSAVASVGATGAIVGLVVNSVIGLSGGTNILLARAVGAGDRERARRLIGTTLLLSVGLGVLVAALGISLAPWFLEITACPVQSFAGATTYLRIYFASAPAIFVYNFGAAIIRVSGDSRRPLYYMTLAGVLNVVLNLLLCVLMTDKVAAVAIATVASQLLGAILVMIHLFKIEGMCHVDVKNLGFSAREMLAIIQVGLPGAFNSALYSISNLQIQAAINSFGPSATAGNAASANMEILVGSFNSAFGMASLAMIGQNIGAGNRERVKKSIFWCTLLNAAVVAVVGWTMLLLSRQLLFILLPNNPLAIEFGRVRMMCLLSIYFIPAVNTVFGSAISAFGYPSIPMISSIFTVLVWRVIWMNFIYPYMTFTGEGVKDIFNLYICYSISWSMTFVAIAATFILLYVRYKKGKVKEL